MQSFCVFHHYLNLAGISVFNAFSPVNISKRVYRGDEQVNN